MRALEKQYCLMYRLGLAPWDGAPAPTALRELTEGPQRLAVGRALDLGCGTGRHAARLADLGWSVLAVDVSPVAIAKARERTALVDWQVADLRELATMPPLLRTAGTTDLILDLGCLHGLDGSGQQAWAACARAAAGPRAVAVVGALPPGRRPGLPRGISGDQIASLLGPGWSRRPHDRDAYVFDRRE